MVCMFSIPKLLGHFALSCECLSFTHIAVCVLCVCVCVCFVGVHQVVDVSKRISDVPEWFKGARLNYAENLLKHGDQDKVALYAASESIITRSNMGSVGGWVGGWKVTHGYQLHIRQPAWRLHLNNRRAKWKNTGSKRHRNDNNEPKVRLKS